MIEKSLVVPIYRRLEFSLIFFIQALFEDNNSFNTIHARPQKQIKNYDKVQLT